MRFGLITDLHWMAKPPASPIAWHNPGEFAGVLDRVQLALEHFADCQVDLVVGCGDFAHHGDLDSIANTLRSLGAASAPVLVVSGNHDVADDERLMERALEHAAVDGITLPTPTGSPIDGVRVAGLHVNADEGWFGVRLRQPPDTAAWGQEPTVLISHFPALSLATRITANGFPYPGDLMDRQQLEDRLTARGAPTVVVSGHVHARAAETQGCVLQLTCSAMVEPPYECAVIDVEQADDGVVTVRRQSIRLGEPASRREPVFSAAEEQWAFDGTSWAQTSLVDECV